MKVREWKVQPEGWESGDCETIAVDDDAWANLYGTQRKDIAAELAFYSRFTTLAKKELETLMGQKSEAAAGALAVLRKLFERAEKET